MATHLARRTIRKTRRTKPSLEALEERSLLAAAVPGMTLDPLLVPKFVNPLPNPLDPDFVFQPTGTTTATLQNETTATVPLYQVGAFQIQEDLGLGLTDARGNPIKTTVYGYGTSATTATYPGHSFVVQSGQPIAVQWIDGLPAGQHLLPVDPTVLNTATNDQSGTPYYTVTKDSTTGAQTVNFTYGVPIDTHVHGGHTTAAFDGTPLGWFTGGGQLGPEYPANHIIPFTYDNSQQATTLWYHDHAMGITRLNVYAGLAGFYIIHDTNENKLIAHHRLPDESYDIPLAIQDRMFTTDGQLYYPADVEEDTTATYPSAHPEFFGDTILVNGQAWPYLDVEPRMYRFRILDGSNSRFYNLHFSIQDSNQPSDQTFFQIGTDEGLLKKPVSLGQLLIAPGERADIVVDFSKLAGKTLIVTNDAPAPFPSGDPENFNPATVGQIMEIRVDKPLNPKIPDAYRFSTTATMNTTIVPFGHADNTRSLALYENTDQYGRLIQQLGTLAGPTAFQGPITEVIKQGDTEIWKIYNTTGDTHPIHLHQVSFQLISRQQFTWTTTSTGGITVTGLIGKPTGPDANEAGWKDTVRMNPGEVTIIEAKFDLPGKYVWHCHILEHEEHDMMHFFQVVGPSSAPQPAAAQQIASPSVASTMNAVVPSVQTGAPNSSVTDGTIPLLNGQIGPLLSTDGENAIDPLAADILTLTRKKRR